MMQHKNTSRPNRNTLYIALSGGGKSQALLQNAEMPGRGARVLLFDPNEDHPWCSRFDDLGKFKRAAKAACQQWYKAKRGFRVAYTGPQSPKIHAQWCKFILTLLDGRFETWIIDEELSGSYGNTAAKAEYSHAVLMNQARKYGGIYHGTTQKPAEIPKTVYDQCAVWWIGQVGVSTAKRVAEEMFINYQLLIDQPELHFYIKDRKKYGREAVPTQLNWRDPDLVTRAQRAHVVK